MSFSKSLSLLFLSLLILNSNPALAKEVDISVAASMTEAFKTVAGKIALQHPDIMIRYNFGSSGSLAKQIAQGAPADIFVSANTTWMDYLVKEKKIDGAHVRVFAHNSLVFVGDKDKNVTSLKDLVSLERIALGSPRSVPAGQYAEQALMAAGIYDALLSGNKLIMAKDVRQALLYADRGEADGAFVYGTDARLAQKAVIRFTVPKELYEQITYPLALTQSGTANKQAEIVYHYLIDKEAMEVFKSYGFESPVPCLVTVP
ncbi:MAG: molybdate ABC transporter substrate-binding protein [Proteobacteria bacterium]|nr:molybdate ABC transporter substrate-binding protein [Pseudomonadota bacterium]